MKLSRRAFTEFTLAALALSVPAAAQDSLTIYDVELIIFRFNRPNATPENWALIESSGKQQATQGDDDPAPTGTTPATNPAVTAPLAADSFAALGPGQFRMNAVEESLRKGKTYQTLAHIGWTQPGFLLGSSPKVSLQPYLSSFPPEGVSLSGDVMLSRGTRLLHLMIDLTYQAPDGQRYVLRETRRMKSMEKHYLDNPYFGVIALITPKT